MRVYLQMNVKTKQRLQKIGSEVSFDHSEAQRLKQFGMSLRAMSHKEMFVGQFHEFVLDHKRGFDTAFFKMPIWHLKEQTSLEKKYDHQFKIVFDAIRDLMAEPIGKGRKIGFLR